MVTILVPLASSGDRVPKLSFFGAALRGLTLAVSGCVLPLCADDGAAIPAIEIKNAKAANKDNRKPRLAAIPRVSKLQRIFTNRFPLCLRRRLSVLIQQSVFTQG